MARLVSVNADRTHMVVCVTSVNQVSGISPTVRDANAMVTLTYVNHEQDNVLTVGQYQCVITLARRDIFAWFVLGTGRKGIIVIVV